MDFYVFLFGRMGDRILHLMKQRTRWSRSSKESQLSQKKTDRLSLLFFRVCANYKKRNGRQKTYPPPAQVCYFRSLSCACHRYMNVTGQTLLSKKEGLSNHQTIRHRIFPCGGFQT
jgi:hypothetical protein